MRQIHNHRVCKVLKDYATQCEGKEQAGMSDTGLEPKSVNLGKINGYAIPEEGRAAKCAALFARFPLCQNT